jgi:hypothetical protein
VVVAAVAVAIEVVSPTVPSTIVVLPSGLRPVVVCVSVVSAAVVPAPAIPSLPAPVLAVVAISSSLSVIAVVPPSSVIMISPSCVPLRVSSTVPGTVARFLIWDASVAAWVAATAAVPGLIIRVAVPFV